MIENWNYICSEYISKTSLDIEVIHLHYNMLSVLQQFVTGRRLLEYQCGFFDNLNIPGISCDFSGTS